MGIRTCACVPNTSDSRHFAFPMKDNIRRATAFMDQAAAALRSESVERTPAGSSALSAVATSATTPSIGM